MGGGLSVLQEAWLISALGLYLCHTHSFPCWFEVIGLEQSRGKTPQIPAWGLWCAWSPLDPAPPGACMASASLEQPSGLALPHTGAQG